MEIVVAGRHTEVSPRYRAHLENKLAKIEQLAPRAQRVDVIVSHEPNPRQSDSSERVEITVVDNGIGGVNRDRMELAVLFDAEHAAAVTFGYRGRPGGNRAYLEAVKAVIEAGS